MDADQDHGKSKWKGGLRVGCYHEKGHELQFCAGMLGKSRKTDQLGWKILKFGPNRDKNHQILNESV